MLEIQIQGVGRPGSFWRPREALSHASLLTSGVAGSPGHSLPNSSLCPHVYIVFLSVHICVSNFTFFHLIRTTVIGLEPNLNDLVLRSLSQLQLQRSSFQIGHILRCGVCIWGWWCWDRGLPIISTDSKSWAAGQIFRQKFRRCSKGPAVLVLGLQREAGLGTMGVSFREGHQQGDALHFLTSVF